MKRTRTLTSPRGKRILGERDKSSRRNSIEAGPLGTGKDATELRNQIPRFVDSGDYPDPGEDAGRWVNG